MIINVDTVRGMNMEMNSQNFDKIDSDYVVKWHRAKIFAEGMCYPIFTEWCEDLPALQNLRTLVKCINESKDNNMSASIQCMDVNIIRGMIYGLVEDEEE